MVLWFESIKERSFFTLVCGSHQLVIIVATIAFVDGL